MGLYSNTNKSARTIFASLAIIAAIEHFFAPVSGQPAAAGLPAKTSSKASTTSPAANQQSTPAFRARTDNTNPAAGTWNRTPNRSIGLWTQAQVDPKKKPTIQFASASGMDENVTSAVAESTSQESQTSEATVENPTDPASEAKATPEETSTPAIASESVKEQLLKALRQQREAIENPNVLKPTTPQGSLTIMNSPRATPNPPTESTKPVTPPSATPASAVPSVPDSPLLANQAGLAATDQNPATQAESSKSKAGLTETLQEDLKSHDAYIRERAKRLLRVQVQILELRARKAAAAEAATQMLTNSTGDNSIPVNQGGLKAISQPLDPSRDLSSGSDGEQSHAIIPTHQTSDENTSQQTSHDPIDPSVAGATQHEDPAAQENISKESPHAALEPSASAALIGKVVVDGPIDRLGLANNLFAVGEYLLAREMYEQTNGTELSAHQQFWVEYQTANCIRRAGNPAEASNRYRKLASRPEAGWLSKQAHWWVETLETIRILEKALDENSVEQSQKVIEAAEVTIQMPPAENAETSTVSESTQSQEPAKDEHSN